MQVLDMDVPVDCGEAVILTTADRFRQFAIVPFPTRRALMAMPR